MWVRMSDGTAAFVADIAEVFALIDAGEASPIDPLPERPDPLDHDGDGEKGGSLPGEQSTAAKGRRKKK